MATDYVQLLRSYYPTGLSPEDPAYKASAEARRWHQAMAVAANDMGGWKAFVQRVRETLPDSSLWDSPALIECVRRYYPLELKPEDPRYEQCAEYQRLEHWRREAVNDSGPWQSSGRRRQHRSSAGERTTSTA